MREYERCLYHVSPQQHHSLRVVGTSGRRRNRATRPTQRRARISAHFRMIATRETDRPI
jgi:hypothetical protein